MSYNGKVEVGGPWQTQLTSQLEIRKLAVGFMDNNAYLLRCRETDSSLLIDAAADPERILAMCDGRLDSVVTTHCHPDHWQALQAVVDATGATTHASAEEAPHIPVRTDVIVHDGQTLPLGVTNLRAVKLVGHRMIGSDHISASIGLIYRDPDGSAHAFTGDAFFPGGVGNTCDDPVAYSQLLNDVASKLFGKLPDRTVVYPGHGWDTTLGKERPHLPEWANHTW